MCSAEVPILHVLAVGASSATTANTRVAHKIPSKAPAQAAKNLHTITNRKDVKLCKAETTIIWHIIIRPIFSNLQVTITKVDGPPLQEPVDSPETFTGHWPPNTRGCLLIVLWYWEASKYEFPISPQAFCTL